VESPVGSVYSRVGLPSLAVRAPACPALRSPMVASAAWNKGASSLLLLVGLAAAGGGFGGRLSSRVDCSGGGHLEVVFVLVPRRLDDAASGVVMRIRSLGSTGASVAGLLWLARIWRILASVLLRGFVDGGSGSASRRRRRERPDLRVDVLLGARPRPARHSDRWVPCVLLLGVFKAMRRWSCFGLGFAGGCSSSSRRLGVGEVGCFRAGGAESSEDFGVISISFGFLSVICTACRILLDRSVVSVCTYFVLRLLLA
jgi:hypothetical protein